VEDKQEPESDDDDDEEYEYKSRWGPILAITDSSFIALAQRISPSTSTLWEVEKRTEGTFNHAVILKNLNTRIVIKVPVVATPARWQAAQAKIMRSQVHTMTHIKTEIPHFPIPCVIAWDTTFNNEIQVPYLAETFIEGKSAWNIWYDKDKNGEYDCTNSDFPSEEREKLRVTFLQSLAKTMAELRTLEFDQIGMMYFEDDDPSKATIGPYVEWLGRGNEENRLYFERSVAASAEEYYIDQVREKELPMDKPQTKAISIILDSIFKSSPFDSSKKTGEEKETFTFRHDDLALQNIICSDKGEVTGIIDWDNVSTVPRCVGFSSLPFFLWEDWDDYYVLSKEYVHSPWTLDRYRNVYANAMIGVCGVDSDAKYTAKSHIYN
ncbi:hypothetical protein K504DRAFT_356865, partial [Pleomassaria siparia CBS 279.74]